MNISEKYSRRDFLEFCGRSVKTGMLLPVVSQDIVAKTLFDDSGNPLFPDTKDRLSLVDGLSSRILIKWGDTINSRGDKFGFNNDYLAFIPFEGKPEDGLLWVNHEEVLSGYFAINKAPAEKTIDDVKREMREVGGSILRLKKHNGTWQVIKDDQYNRRVDAVTQIPLITERPIRNAVTATGTLANCAGGITPWQSILTCEENYHFFYGEVNFKRGKRKFNRYGLLGWRRFYDYPPEHYGWVVEVNPLSGKAKKLTALGRFAHESALVVQAHDGRCVVYMGDDKINQCIYKFIADKPGSLEEGILYVADTDRGHWLPLHIDKNKEFRNYFRDQTDVLIRTREAAAIAGGTPQDRPEDIEQDPETKAIYVALTKNPGAGRPFGSILKLEEKVQDPLAMEFTTATFLAGGKANGFACPDNLVFDPRGNMWFSSDISGLELNKEPYTSFGNNGLFYVPMSGVNSGVPVQVASAPGGAELTGMMFAADGRTLFLSVQHPGENSKSVTALSSHWPDGGNTIPKPAVVAITGEFLDKHCSA